MSTNVPAAKIKITDLEVHERAEYGHKFFLEKAKGKSVRSLAIDNGFTEGAVRKLIAEYGAYLQQTRTFSKESNIAAYDFVLEKAAEIIENPHQYSVLLQAKGYEAFIQALTRKDKLLGHEAPTHNINTKGETVANLWNKMFGSEGDSQDISPMDSGYIGEEEEIEDAEVIDDSTDDGEEHPIS